MQAADTYAIDRAVQHAVAAQAALGQGRPRTAVAHARAAVEIFGAGSADGANVLVVLSRALCVQGDWDDAEAAARDALAALAELAGGEPLDRIRVHARHALGEVLLARGDYPAAGKQFTAALQDAERTLGGEDSDTASLLNSRGLVARYRGDFATAERHYTRALQIVHDSAGPDDLQAAGLQHKPRRPRARPRNACPGRASRAASRPDPPGGARPRAPACRRRQGRTGIDPARPRPPRRSRTAPARRHRRARTRL